MAKKKGKRKTVGAGEPVRSDTDLDFRVRHERSEEMKEKFGRVRTFVRKRLALYCRTIKATRGDPNRLEEAIPYLGNLPDAWVARYGRIPHSAVKNLRIRNRIPAYDYEGILEEAMLRLEGETGMAEMFLSRDPAETALLFGMRFSPDAQNADAV